MNHDGEKGCDLRSAHYALPVLLRATFVVADDSVIAYEPRRVGTSTYRMSHSRSRNSYAERRAPRAAHDVSAPRAGGARRGGRRQRGRARTDERRRVTKKSDRTSRYFLK